MATMLTCPRCDSREPAANLRCGACGHDLRTPVLESLDPPSERLPWRATIWRFSPAAPLVVSVAALVIATVSLAATLLEPNLVACGQGLWDRPVVAEDVPDGWALRNRAPTDVGWTALIEQTAGPEGFGGGAFVQVSCSPNPERQLAILRDWSSESGRVDFPTFGDETVVVRDGSSGGYQVWWRSDRVVGQISWFGPDTQMDLLETVTEFVFESSR